MRINEGDTVVVKKKHYGWEPYSVGDVFTVHSVERDESGDDGWDVLTTVGYNDDYMMFAAEVERVEAPKDYEEMSLADALVEAINQLREGLFTTNTVEIDGDIPQASIDIQAADDVVAAPKHYTSSGIEPIAYMADKLPAYDDGFLAFCVGNTIKYVSRAPHKHETPLEDLKKARQYLDFAIKHLEDGE